MSPAPETPDAVRDYREYAMTQLRIAIEKDADAPASAQMHEEQAALALRLQRIPEPGEVLSSIQFAEAEARAAVTALQKIVDEYAYHLAVLSHAYHSDTRPPAASIAVMDACATKMRAVGGAAPLRQETEK